MEIPEPGRGGIQAEGVAQSWDQRPGGGGEADCGPVGRGVGVEGRVT